MLKQNLIPCLVLCFVATAQVDAQSPLNPFGLPESPASEAVDDGSFDMGLRAPNDPRDLFESIEDAPSDDVGIFDSPPSAEEFLAPNTDALQRWNGETTRSRQPQQRYRARGPFTVHQRGLVTTRAQQQPLSNKERARFGEVTRLRQQIREEKDEKKRTELGETLRTKLGEIFDDDLSERDEQLKELEARVAKLRAAVEKRRKNRDRVITLQVDSVMLAAEGLAFPSIKGGPQTRPNGPWIPRQGFANPPKTQFGTP